MVLALGIKTKETNNMKYSNAFEQSITKEQKELLKADIERTIEGSIKPIQN